MKIANARTFGNQAYVTEADISSAISRHSTEMAHLDSDAVAKLSSIESGATYVDSSTVSGWGYTKLTNAGVSSIATGVVSSVAYTKTEVDSRISAIESKVTNVYSYRGSVDYYSSLPTSGQQDGYVYNVVHADAEHGIAAGANVAWNGTGWDNLGGTIDLSEYALASNVADKAYQTIAVKSNSTATATNLVANAKNATVTIVGGNAMSVTVDTTARTISLGVSTTDVIASNGTLPVVASAVHSALSSKVDSSSLAQVAWTGKYSDLEGKPTTLTPPSQKIDFTSANSTGVSWNSSKTEAVFTHSLDCVPNVTVYDNNWELTYVTIQVGPTPNNSTFRMVLDSPVVSSNAWHCIVTYGHHI